jgi:hypothetical protein
MFLNGSILSLFDLALVNLDLQSPSHEISEPGSYTEIAGAISDNVLGKVPTVGIANFKLFPDQKELLHQVDRVLDSALLFEEDALIDAVVDVLARPIVLVVVNSISVQKPLLQVLRSSGWAVRTARTSFEVAYVTNNVSTQFAVVENDFHDPTGEQATFDQMVKVKFSNKVPTVRLTEGPDAQFVRTEAHIHRRTFGWPNQVLDRLNELHARAGR